MTLRTGGLRRHEGSLRKAIPGISDLGKWVMDCRQLLVAGAIDPRPRIVTRTVERYFVRQSPAPTAESRDYASHMAVALEYLSRNFKGLVQRRILMIDPSDNVRADDPTFVALYDAFRNRPLDGKVFQINVDDFSMAVEARRYYS